MWHCFEIPVLLQTVSVWWHCSSWWLTQCSAGWLLVVLTRGVSCTGLSLCHLGKVSNHVHTGLDFSTPSFSTPWPFTTNHFGKHCSNSPHLSRTSPLHDIYLPVQHLHQIQDWNILVKSRTCQVPRDQFREERDSPVSPVCDCLWLFGDILLVAKNIEFKDSPAVK